MVKKNFLFLMALGIGVFLIENVSAHCPLCTIGAGATAAGAVWLGVSKVVVGLFIGGFSMSMGLWMSRIIKKKYFKFQKQIIISGVFLLTLLPLLPIFNVIGPLHLSFVGEYGKTFAINYSLISGLFGGLIVFLSPSLSRKITKSRNGKIIPFQGTMLTIILLIVAAGVLQIGFVGSGMDSGGDYVISKGSVENFSPDKFKEIIKNDSVFLLNVHTPYEGEIEGTDLIIEDWENIGKYMDKLPRDLSVPIAVYCRSGRMSADVAEELKEMGYKVYNLEGGMNAWENSGMKIIS